MARRIVVVDDHFETLEFLRSLLELADKTYVVAGYPSAEEAWLEMRQASFDLLITDVDLPGMNGFELAKRVRAFRPDTPIVMITANATLEGQQLVSDLGLSHYLSKPLNTDKLLAIIRSALYDADFVRPAQAAAAKAGNRAVGETSESVGARPAQVSVVSPGIRKRIEALRTDTGAEQVMMARVGGEILHAVGNLHGLDPLRLVTTISANMRGSFDLAEQLERQEPFAIHYQAGKDYDLYSTNVGKDYFLAIFFDAHARRGRIGTVWVFAQRAVSDIMALLVTEAPEEAIIEMRPAQRVSPITEDHGQTEDYTQEVNSSLEPVGSASEEMAETAFEIAEIREMLSGDLEVEESEMDLESFWDEALSEAAEENEMSTGISLEEARQKGIISPEFDPDENS